MHHALVRAAVYNLIKSFCSAEIETQHQHIIQQTQLWCVAPRQRSRKKVTRAAKRKWLRTRRRDKRPLFVLPQMTGMQQCMRFLLDARRQLQRFSL
jgi:hypothetical protein